MKNIFKYILLAVALVVVGAAGFVGGVPEVRYLVGYQLWPEAARNAAFDKYTAASGTRLYHLGTIHGQHLANQGFGLGHLQAVIDNLKPTLLMVEVLPAELRRGNPASGPVEMPVATLIAQNAQIPIVGIDWWTEASMRGASPHDRDDKMFEQLQASLPTSGRVLVLTGFSHLLEFRSRYEAAGFSLEPFSQEAKDSLFAGAPEPFHWPDGTDAALLRAITWADARIDSATDDATRENYAEKRGLLQGFRAQLAAPSPDP